MCPLISLFFPLLFVIISFSFVVLSIQLWLHLLMIKWSLVFTWMPVSSNWVRLFAVLLTRKHSTPQYSLLPNTQYCLWELTRRESAKLLIVKWNCLWFLLLLLGNLLVFLSYVTGSWLSSFVSRPGFSEWSTDGFLLKWFTIMVTKISVVDPISLLVNNSTLNKEKKRENNICTLVVL